MAGGLLYSYGIRMDLMWPDKILVISVVDNHTRFHDDTLLYRKITKYIWISFVEH